MVSVPLPATASNLLCYYLKLFGIWMISFLLFTLSAAANVARECDPFLLVWWLISNPVSIVISGVGRSSHIGTVYVTSRCDLFLLLEGKWWYLLHWLSG